MYFGLRGSAYVAKASTMFTPSATYKNDGDGTAVAPVLETPMYGGDARDKTWRGIYVTMDRPLYPLGLWLAEMYIKPSATSLE